jgi:hypothetical protein
MNIKNYGRTDAMTTLTLTEEQKESVLKALRIGIMARDASILAGDSTDALCGELDIEQEKNMFRDCAAVANLLGDTKLAEFTLALVANEIAAMDGARTRTDSGEDPFSAHERLVAMSELARLHDFAMKSDNHAVQAFGMLVLCRISELADHRTEPYTDTLEDLAPLIDGGRRMEAKMGDEDSVNSPAPAGVQSATVVDGKIMSNADLIARAERAEAEYDAAALADANPEDKDE